MGSIWGTATAIFVASAIIPTIYNLTKRRRLRIESKMDKTDFVIYTSKAFVWVAICTLLVMGMILSLLNFLWGFESRSQLLATNLIMIPILFLIAFGTFMWARDIIVVKGDIIKITRALGRNRIITFSQITKMIDCSSRIGVDKSRQEQMFTIFTDKGVTSIACSEIGFNIFMQIVREKGIPIEKEKSLREQIREIKYGNTQREKP